MHSPTEAIGFEGETANEIRWRCTRRLIDPGSVVLDVGGHIGYTALYFASLVGPLGRVLVAEPAPNNLRYLRHNIRAHPTISLFEIGIGDRTEHLPFFIETLTGQNSSFSRAYTSERNAARSFGGSEPISEIRVQMRTLDAFVADVGVNPDFVKIDVEGFEYSVLTGASSLLRDKRPMLMIEIRDSNRDRCFQHLRELGYVLISPELRLLDSANRIQMNTFCLHSEEHRDRLAILGCNLRRGRRSCAVEAAARIGSTLEPFASPSTAPRRSACGRHVPAGLGVPHYP